MTPQTEYQRGAVSVSRALACAGAAIAALPVLAQDQNLGEVAATVTGQFEAIGRFVGALAVLIGVGMIVMAIIKFRAYSSNPADPSASLSGAIGWTLCGAAAIALPEFMGVGVTTLFGDEAAQGELTGGFLGSSLGGGN